MLPPHVKLRSNRVATVLLGSDLASTVEPVTKEGDQPADEQALREQARAAEELNDKMRAAGTDYSELSGRHVTVNQIVAYNVAYFRKAAGLTQDELGHRLRGWTSTPWGKAGVSAVERSWDGKRLRQFDADLLFGLSVALDVPISAFFLPPDIDGINERYLVHAHHPLGEVDHEAGEDYYHFGTMCRSMGEYALYVMSEPDDESPAAAAYRSRLSAASSAYLGVPLAPAEFFEELTSEEQLTERIGRLRAHYAGLREMLGDLEHTMDFLYDRLEEQRKQQAQANPELAKLRQQESFRKQNEALQRHALEILGEVEAGKSIEEISVEHGGMPHGMINSYLKIARSAKDSDDEAT